jgi:hypothetical protein
VPTELLEGQDRHKLLAAWLRGEVFGARQLLTVIHDPVVLAIV